MHLVQGTYKCDWCGTDLGVSSTSSDTMEIITRHEGVAVRVIVVAGDERHRCERPEPSDERPRRRR